MDMRFLTRALLVAAVCLAGTQAGGADRVELKSGDVFSGKILRVTRDEVAIQIASGGVLTFKISLVKRLRRSGTDSTEEEAQAEKAPEEGGAPDATKKEPGPQAEVAPIPGPSPRAAAPGAAPVPLPSAVAPGPSAPPATGALRGGAP